MLKAWLLALVSSVFGIAAAAGYSFAKIDMDDGRHIQMAFDKTERRSLYYFKCSYFFDGVDFVH